MTTSTAELHYPRASDVEITDDSLCVSLDDGRRISVPLAWYPRLTHATPQERDRWEFIGGGRGIHWPAIDEDISVENLLNGKASGESQRSFKRWLESRK